jgi:hypothetical protein
MRIKQFLISVDQTLNTIAGGWADETLSARTYRNSRDGHSKWITAHKIIDAIFFWQPNHCYGSYLSETSRRQLPAEYRDLS